MSISYLKYPLENGYVHNWLVVGRKRPSWLISIATQARTTSC